MIRKMGWFIRLITPVWVSGITIAPFGIYVYDPDDWRVVKHELIHWRQQIELGIIFFYLWYIIEWLIKLFKYGGQAYSNISFERAAYAGDNRHYSFIHYL